MNKSEMVLLDYIIKKSYEDLEAQRVLDLYDSKRTGLSLSTVSLVNSLIRSGNTRLAYEFIKGANDEAGNCNS